MKYDVSIINLTHQPLCDEEMQSDSSQQSLIIPQGMLPKAILPNVQLISKGNYLHDKCD